MYNLQPVYSVCTEYIEYIVRSDGAQSASILVMLPFPYRQILLYGNPRAAMVNQSKHELTIHKLVVISQLATYIT